MKRFLLLLTSLVLISKMYAYEYPYLTFVDTDGSTTSVSVESLVLTISDGKIVATNADGTLSLNISQLSKMLFSTSDLTKIEETVTLTDEEIEVFDTSGRYLGKFDNIVMARQSLSCGIYIIKKGHTAQKFIIK